MLEFSVIVLSAIVLVMQTILCVRSRSRFFKWMPFLCCVLVAAGCFLAGSLVADPWVGASLWLVGTMFIFPIVCCGIGWMTASIIVQHRENRKNHEHEKPRELR